MKFSNSKPLIFDRLHKAFGVEWGRELVIAYDGTVYHSKSLDPSVIVHENVHLVRQKKNPNQWWESYIKDKEFRFKEELLAYHAQYDYLKDTIKDRNELARHLFRLATDLSGKMYGNMVSHSEAMRLIKMQ